MRKTALFALMLSLITTQLFGQVSNDLKLAQGDNISLTFKLSDKVTLTPVQYKNRYGISLAGHMYLPKNIDQSRKYPAILIGTPYGGVKEQGAGIYAMKMAERGFVAVAFDESFNGESGGTPKDVSSPDFFVEDFSAGVDYLGGGWPIQPATAVPAGLPPVFAEFFEYYGMKRGWHPNTINNFTLTSALSFMNFPLMTHLEEISPRPILFIMGENAHSRYYTEEAYEKAVEPKELIIIPGARHIDLYDGGDKNYIPFDKLESFFKQYLK